MVGEKKNISNSGVYTHPLEHISLRSDHTAGLLSRWVGISSRSGDRQGLDQMAASLEDVFSKLGGNTQLLDLGCETASGCGNEEAVKPLGRALKSVMRPEAPLQILLCGHMDTVMATEAHEKKPGTIENGKLWGPGALDGKGGLAVMLAALQAVEEFPAAEEIGWQVIVGPDEEIGSPGSEILYTQDAGRFHLGLLFEPALPDGALIENRPGSGNFSVTIHGKSAHAGREPELGRNAVHALADFIVELRKLEQWGPGIHVNVGSIEGGGPVNVVPDFARCRFNIRIAEPGLLNDTRKELQEMATRFNASEGFSIDIAGNFRRPPKIVDDRTRHILNSLAACGKDLGMDIKWRSSGGVCDGNTLAAAGLPNVDSLGPVGDGMHTPREFVLVDSIGDRARLVALFMMKLASKEISWFGAQDPLPGTFTQKRPSF